VSPPNLSAAISDDELTKVFERAGARLGECAWQQRIVVLVAWPKPPDEIAVRPSGWCELGTIGDAAGRFWWTVYWHAQRRQGRLVRSFPKAKRGTLGEVIPD
jgi:hypothetical protein